MRFYTDVERELAMTQRGAGGPMSLAELCSEAVERFGDDWGRIAAYLAEQLDQMPCADRQAFDHEISRILSFRAPDRQNALH